jgi:hypothetical protein
MTTNHQKDWEEIIRLVTKDELYTDVHKFYSVKGGWLRLTDKLGQRYEIVFGNTVKFFRETAATVIRINNYSPHWQRKLTRYVQSFK